MDAGYLKVNECLQLVHHHCHLPGTDKVNLMTLLIKMENLLLRNKIQYEQATVERFDELFRRVQVVCAQQNDVAALMEYLIDFLKELQELQDVR